MAQDNATSESSASSALSDNSVNADSKATDQQAADQQATDQQEKNDASTAITDAAKETLNKEAAADPAAAKDAETFYGSIKDEKIKTWAESKGFKSAESVVEAAYNLEKLIGFDKAGKTVVIPGEDATPEQIKAFHQKMGVPEKVEDYNLPLPEGDDGAFAKVASDKFLELGVPAKTAQELATWWNGMIETQTADADTQFNVSSENEFKSWKAEQGAAYEQNLELAKRASSQFIPATDAKQRQEVMDKMERAMGTGAFMKFMLNVGKGLSEHKMIGSGDPGNLVPTPAQAKQKIEELKSNKEWRESYLAGDKAKIKEMEDLQKLAHGAN